jgi:hypothetical protein
MGGGARSIRALSVVETYKLEYSLKLFTQAQGKFYIWRRSLLTELSIEPNLAGMPLAGFRRTVLKYIQIIHKDICPPF